MTTTSTKPEALLWIDMETTGPDRTTAQILEIGMACTDSTATQDYGAFHAIVKPDILDISRITPWAWEHHTANGLIAEVRAAMKIDYFDDKELIAEQARQYQQQR